MGVRATVQCAAELRTTTGPAGRRTGHAEMYLTLDVLWMLCGQGILIV
jgi:hypothetical protein